MSSLIQNRATATPPVQESTSKGQGESTESAMDAESHRQLTIVWKISNPKTSKPTKSKRKASDEPAKGSSGDESKDDDDGQDWSDEDDHDDLSDEEVSSSDDDEVPVKLVDKLSNGCGLTNLESAMVMIDLKFRLPRTHLKKKRFDRDLMLLIKFICFPKDESIPKPVVRMVTNFSQLEGMNPVTQNFCTNCKKSFSKKINCPDCKLKKSDQFTIFNLQPQLQKILPNLSAKLGTDKAVKELTMSLYKNCFRKIGDKNFIWPLVLTIDELPEDKRVEEDTVLIAGFWHGDNANLEGFSEALHVELKKLKAGFLAGKEPGSSSDVLVTPDTIVFSVKEGTKKIKLEC